MKKLLLITLLLLFTTSYATFTDMSESHWAYNAVAKMEKASILSGYPDGTFKPNKNITLAEFATIFSNFFSISAEDNANYFTDIPYSHWGKSKIEALRKYIEPEYNSIAESLDYYDYFSEAGIVANMPITREIVIYSLYNIFGYDDSLYIDGEEKELFEDFDKILYPKAVCIAYKNGVVSGEKIEDKVYMNPQRYITRAEISAMFNNLLGYNDKIENKEGFDVLGIVVDKTLNAIKNKNYNEVTNYLYDTQNVLDSVDFSKVIDEDLEKIIKMWYDTFTYDIRKHGFYSYNHAYLEVETIELDLTEFVNTFYISYKDLTTDKLEQIVDDFAFKRLGRFYRKANSRIIEFVKVNNEWKIKL